MSRGVVGVGVHRSQSGNMDFLLLLLFCLPINCISERCTLWSFQCNGVHGRELVAAYQQVGS
jgi:hypothetical protein